MMFNFFLIKENSRDWKGSTCSCTSWNCICNIILFDIIEGCQFCWCFASGKVIWQKLVPTLSKLFQRSMTVKVHSTLLHISFVYLVLMWTRFEKQRHLKMKSWNFLDFLYYFAPIRSVVCELITIVLLEYLSILVIICSFWIWEGRGGSWFWSQLTASLGDDNMVGLDLRFIHCWMLNVEWTPVMDHLRNGQVREEASGYAKFVPLKVKQHEIGSLPMYKGPKSCLPMEASLSMHPNNSFYNFFFTTIYMICCD